MNYLPFTGVVILCLCIMSLQGQNLPGSSTNPLREKSQRIKNVSVSLLSEATAIPFTRYMPIHPGAELGLGLHEVEKKVSYRSINAYIGGFWHRRVASAMYLRLEYMYIFNIQDVVGIELPISVGYLHTFHPADLYVQNEVTGEFEKISQLGRPHALVQGGLGIRYLGNPNIQPFIRQSLGIETPFANTFPFMIHSFLNAGVTIHLNNNRHE